VEVIDTQLHDPVPWLDFRSHEINVRRRLAIDLTLGYLDAVGVDRALLFSSEELGAFAAQRFPTRLAYVISITPDATNVDDFIASAKIKRRGGLVGVRAVVGWPFDGSEARRVQAGNWDPIFSACERCGVPLFMFITGWLPLAAEVAKRYPELAIIIDHSGLPQPPATREDPPFRSLPALLALAEHSNIAIKLCGLPALSTESFPYQDVVPHLRTIVDEFGAERLMWASDITRIYGRVAGDSSIFEGTQGNYPGRHTYAESLNFIRYCDALTEEEKQAILGGTAARLVGWSSNVAR
jgi:predicted TIM-barrel fold metal-dependent hydrolase